MTVTRIDPPSSSSRSPSPSSVPSPRRSRGQRWALAAIVWYQRLVDGRLSPCRFFPSCSSYALDAFEVHGSRRGLWLTVRRLLRCRPLGPSGFDPVPIPTDHRCADEGATGAHRCIHPHPDVPHPEGPDVSHRDVLHRDVLQQDVLQQDVLQQDVLQQDVLQQDVLQQDVKDC